MTIPEAAQLVIQAGAMAEGGDVFVLDMGEPVRIIDLARAHDQLSGLTRARRGQPGRRHRDPVSRACAPAEKLYEELLIGENVSGTQHPRIMRAEEDFIPEEALKPLLGDLVMAASQLDRERMRNILRDTVKEYRPTNDIDDLIWGRRRLQAAVAEDNVVVLKPVVRPDRDSSVA